MKKVIIKDIQNNKEYSLVLLEKIIRQIGSREIYGEIGEPININEPIKISKASHKAYNVCIVDNSLVCDIEPLNNVYGDTLSINSIMFGFKMFGLGEKDTLGNVINFSLHSINAVERGL